ncbi:hypothetical protein LWI28_003431 [Acer negundo]|uniref:PPM-type phosphatase domain-containing protein n=1 Tax=Acer negundo TaxID=4023 RepID=A0AAD5J2N4_ACENE|nr:hypothetical protein LWI28_003431 [Acer negundo]
MGFGLRTSTLQTEDTNLSMFMQWCGFGGGVVVDWRNWGRGGVDLVIDLVAVADWCGFGRLVTDLEAMVWVWRGSSYLRVWTLEIITTTEQNNYRALHCPNGINNAIAQALLAKRLGKQRIIAGQHGVATATVCARFGLQCFINMGAQDMERQSLNVFRMRLLGAEVRAVHSGTATLKDAIFLKDEGSAEYYSVIDDEALEGDQYLKPYVISEPELTISERRGTDEFIVIASDELWDIVSNELACEVKPTNSNSKNDLSSVFNNPEAIDRFLKVKCRSGVMCKPNTVSYNSFIDGLCKHGLVDKAKELFLEMKGVGIGPDVVSFTTLIQGLCYGGKWEDAKDLIDEMVDQHVHPNVVTFTVIIDDFCKNGKIDKANKLLELIVKRGRLKIARKLFHELPQEGLEPNIVTYNIMEHGLCKEGKLEEANNLLSIMEEEGCALDLITNNTLMCGFLQNNETTKVIELLHKMVERNIMPNASTTSIVIDLLVKDEKYRKCLKLLPSFPKQKPTGS